MLDQVTPEIMTASPECMIALVVSLSGTPGILKCEQGYTASGQVACYLVNHATGLLYSSMGVMLFKIIFRLRYQDYSLEQSGSGLLLNFSSSPGQMDAFMFFRVILNEVCLFIDSPSKRDSELVVSLRSS